MRLLKIGVYYSSYLAQFYSRRPNFASESFEFQHSALMDDCFGSSDFWTTALTKLGYETCDLVANAEPLQKKWAKEHGLVFNERNWLFEITAAQIKAFRPDVLLVADYTTVTGAFLDHLKVICPSIRLVLGWCGAPYRDDSIFRQCDVVLSCVPELVDQFQKEGHVSRHVNHAFDSRVLERINIATEPNADFTFIGSIVKSDHFHIGREKIIAQLVRETDLQLWSEAGCQSSSGTQQHRSLADETSSFAGNFTRQIGGLSLVAPVRRRVSRFIFGSHPTLPIVDMEIRRLANPPLFGLKMFQQLHDSRVTLNTHIDISPLNASNMRLFEATGVGTCLLTDWKANLATLFKPDSEVVTFRDTDECVEKIKYLLEHDDERRAIATAGQARTLRDHTFEDRAQQIDATIKDALSGASAVAR
ncbi:MAG TPA: glycosyltransferase [Pyrinomonadaceae bacterium]